MVYPPNSRHACTPTAPTKFDALCMALGLPDAGSRPACSPQPQPPKLRLQPAGGVRKVQQQRKSKFAAAAAAAVAERGMATPPRLADQPRRRQPFALSRPPRPLPPIRRLQHAAPHVGQAARAAGSCDSVTSPNMYTSNHSTDSHGVMSPTPLSTGRAAILATGMRLILATMSPFDACQLAAARSFLAAFPPAC